MAAKKAEEARLAVLQKIQTARSELGIATPAKIYSESAGVRVELRAWLGLRGWGWREGLEAAFRDETEKT